MKASNVALISVNPVDQISDIELNKVLAKLAIEKGIWAKVS